VALAGCSSSKKKSSGGLGGGSTTSGSSSNQTYTIGFIGALSGGSAQLGINEKQGATLAISQWNAANKGFQAKLDAQDSEGAAATAPAAATALTTNSSVIATIGPAFSGESKAVDPTFCAAGMPIVTASASNATLQDQGYNCWHRIIPNDNVEGSQGADWLARTGSKKVFVLDDGSPYGEGVATTVATELKAKNVSVVTGRVPYVTGSTTSPNYNPIANTIVNDGVDALFYGGYDSQTALLAKALVGAGFKGREVSGNGSKDSTFTTQGGSAAEKWYLTCGCQDPTKAPAAASFVTAYTAMFHQAPSTYSAEAFDAANVLLDSIKNAAAKGTVTRASVLTALNAENFPGITTTIKFQSNGEVIPSNLIVNLFQVKGGQIVGLGDITKINS
jgi:branched-chain amino acid transport system substrate-binding protein